MLALSQRVGATVSREAPCVIAATFFLVLLAAFLVILFAKTSW